MLRRNSSKSKPDLSRRKSTTSVHGVHLEHIDPAVAQRDAQAAACQAFSRAQAKAQEQLDMPLFPPTPASSPRRRNVHVDNGSDGLDGGTPTGHRIDSPGELRRRQSVRYMGPCSSRGMESHGAETNSTRSPNGPQQLKVVNVPQREPPPVPLPGMASDYLVALAAEEEYYTPEDNIASAPSSYRRLRKSRSMFTTDAAVGTGGSLAAHLKSVNRVGTRGSRTALASSAHRLAFSDNDGYLPSLDVPQLRAPKSMSFLRTRGRRSGSVTTQGTKNGDVQTTPAIGQRRQRLRETSQEHPRLVSKSSFFSSRSRHTEVVLRKSLRSDSSTGDPEAISNQPVTAPVYSDKEDRFRVKARKVSRSLKAKLKNIFGLGKSEEEPPPFPPQHITAQRTHVNEAFLSPVSSNLDQDFKTEVGWSSVHRVPSGVPSIQVVPPNLVHSSRVSLESLRSGVHDRKVSDDKSLTSWACSGPSTLTSQQQQEWREWERQRLSIINENVAHVPNVSFQRKALGTHILHNGIAPPGNPVPPGPIVDSQRVYSALMKRVRESNTQTDEEQSQEDLGDPSHGVTDTAPSAASSGQESIKTPNEECNGSTSHEQSRSAAGLDTPTRASKREGLRLSRPTFDGRQCRSGSPSPMNTFSRDHEWVRRDERKGFEGSVSERFAFNSAATTPNVNLPDPFVDEDKSQYGSNGQRPDLMSPRGRGAIDTPTSHLFRTKPPYRQTLRKSIETELLLNGGGASETARMERIANDMFSKYGPDAADDTQYSESIYSTDDYRRDNQTDSSARLGQRLQGTQSPPLYRHESYRNRFSVSSIDWQTWLSENMEKFQSSPTPPLPSEIEYALPTMPKSFQPGHVRELAQTHDEDEDVQRSEPPTQMPMLPISPLATVEPNVLKVSPLQCSIKRTSPRSDGKTLVENYSPHGAPSNDVKNSVRVVPSPLRCGRSNVGYSNPSSVTSSPGLSAALQRQFGSGPKYRETENHYAQRQIDYNDRTGSYGARMPSSCREGKLRMIENDENNNDQHSGGAHEESIAFL
ncbi:hypothetical protein V8F20_000029 [Naviculisporaceae sp. PSN 640]